MASQKHCFLVFLEIDIPDQSFTGVIRIHDQGNVIAGLEPSDLFGFLDGMAGPVGLTPEDISVFQPTSTTGKMSAHYLAGNFNASDEDGSDDMYSPDEKRYPQERHNYRKIQEKKGIRGCQRLTTPQTRKKAEEGSGHIHAPDNHRKEQRQHGGIIRPDDTEG
jgi:hypothetical protein